MTSNDVGTSYRPIGLFKVLFSELHMCSGSSTTEGRHIQTPTSLLRRRIHQVTPEDHKKYNGSFTDYFSDFISIEKDPISVPKCWRIQGSNPICNGKREDHRCLVTSMPILYSVEIGTDEADIAPLNWDFPETLKLLRKGVTKAGLIYDLVGYALINAERNHWIARFSSGNKKNIYTYDGRENNGISIKEPHATFKSHMVGAKINLPAGYSVYQVFYNLRGGPEAQDLFYKMRTKDLGKRFNISFTETSLINRCSSIIYKAAGFVRMKAHTRFWIRDPYNTPTAEYISEASAKEIDDLDDSGPEPEDNQLQISLQTETVIAQPKIPRKPLSSSHSSAESLPDSLFDLSCRCGQSGDGNKLYSSAIYGEAIQCDECKTWSHTACQRNGRASMLGKKEKFTCDHCDITYLLPSSKNVARRSSTRK